MILQFAYPAAFALLLLPLLLALIHGSPLGGALPTMIFSDTRLASGITVSWRVRLRRLPDVLRVLGWTALVVALARPQAGQTQEILRGQGVDIVMALDISGSMGTRDFDGQTRLAAAKQVIGSFVRSREFDRIGLVVFAREAFHQAPPTLDYGVLLRLLDDVQLAPDLGLDDGTAIGMGLASAANMLRSSEAASRVVILLTDGANNAGALDPLTAARAARAFDVRVYTISVGRVGPGAAATENRTAEIGRADQGENTLRQIAAIAGGAHFRAADLNVLQRVYDEINRLERSDVERQILVRWQEQAGSWIAAALALLIAERLLRITTFQTLP
ncbi:MAG: VWA domain-containing protein [Aggregatilineales bacterium]